MSRLRDISRDVNDPFDGGGDALHELAVLFLSKFDRCYVGVELGRWSC